MWKQIVSFYERNMGKRVNAGKRFIPSINEWEEPWDGYTIDDKGNPTFVVSEPFLIAAQNNVRSYQNILNRIESEGEAVTDDTSSSYQYKLNNM